MKIAIVGAGWAGLSAAVTAIQAGHAVTLYEASRTIGGRARALPGQLPDGSAVTLDNGQHILIGAYHETLRLMHAVGVDAQQALLRLPLTLRFPDGGGLQFPRCPAPLDALAGIAGARGWSLVDKASLLWLATRWRLAGFQCPAGTPVTELCLTLTPTVMRELIEPLCVSALNTPAERASGQVFLRILRDSVLGASGDSNLLLPRVDLSALFPAAAGQWLRQHGATVEPGTRVRQLAQAGAHWLVNTQPFDRVILATPAPDASRLLASSLGGVDSRAAHQLAQWRALADTLRHEAITTVYAWGAGARLVHPMLVLRSHRASPQPAPAQFVFDRGQLGGPAGLLAFVVSASTGDRASLQAQVLAQAGAELGLDLQAVQTVVEKRATFACTPALQRPAMRIAAGLLACGDYVDGPYPSTLEGAVRSGCSASRQSSGSAS